MRFSDSPHLSNLGVRGHEDMDKEGSLAPINQPEAARKASRGWGRGQRQPLALGVADGGRFGPKPWSGAHVRVPGHEIGHSDKVLSEIGHPVEVTRWD